MRTVLAIASLTAVLAGLPVVGASAAEAAAAVPAVNAGFLTKAGDLAKQLLGQATSGLDVAKTAAALPFAGAATKAKVATAETQVSSAKQLQGELATLSNGGKPAADGILASLSSGTGPSLADRFQGLPLASTLQSVLGNQEIVSALIAAAPLDGVPGYATAKQALAAFGQ